MQKNYCGCYGKEKKNGSGQGIKIIREGIELWRLNIKD